MRLAGILAAATLPVAFTAAAQQRVLAHSTSMRIEDLPSSMASTPALANSTTDPLTQPPKPLTTAAVEKPTLEASVMGLIVFSVAGLCLI